MTRMKRIAIVLFLIMFMILQTIPLSYAYNVQLQVTFIPQVPPGNWNDTRNCGQTSALMDFCYYNKTAPTVDGISNIDDWLQGKFGHPTRNYNGSYTDISILEILAREYGGFPDSHKYGNWNLQQLRNELSAGYPIIVATHTHMDARHGLGHFMLLVGMNDHNVYINDPGLTHGGNNHYPIDQFARSWAAQSNSCVTIHPLSPEPEPEPEKPQPPEKVVPPLKGIPVKNVTIVIVIDDSWSNERNDPENKRLEAAKFLIDSAADNDKVAVISFNREPSVLSPLTVLENQEKRDMVKSQISLQSINGTDFNKSLKEAYQILKDDQSHNKKAVVFLTDGAHEGPESYDDNSHLQFKEINCPTYTVLLESEKPSPPPTPHEGWFPDPDLLSKIASDTQGKFHPAPSPEALKEIYQEISASVQGQTNVFSESVTLGPEEEKEEIFAISEKATQFVFSTSWPGSDIKATLTTPNGIKIDPETKNSDIRHIKEETYQIYEIQNPQPGDWKMHIKAENVTEQGEKVDINVSAKIDEQKPRVSICKPLPGHSVAIPIKIEARASDNIQVKKVEFYYRLQNKKKWKKIGIDTNIKDGWGMIWRTDNSGLVEIKAIALDKAGNSASSSHYIVLDNQKPKITKVKIPQTNIWGFKLPILTSQKAKISYSIQDKDSPMKTKILIKNSKGKIIRIIKYKPDFPHTNILQDKVKLIWNGKNEKKKVVPWGKYQIIIIVSDKAGYKTKVTKNIINFSLPAIWQGLKNW